MDVVRHSVAGGVGVGRAADESGELNRTQAGPISDHDAIGTKFSRVSDGFLASLCKEAIACSAPHR